MTNITSFQKIPFQTALPLVKESNATALRTPADIAALLSDIANIAQEAFVIITLNTKNHMIDKHLITLGIANASLVHPREVFRAAIADGASELVIAHNHPSGDPNPSAEDIRITKQLIEAGSIIDIHILDHIIIGRGDTPFLSLRESGLVAFRPPS